MSLFPCLKEDQFLSKFLSRLLQSTKTKPFDLSALLMQIRSQRFLGKNACFTQTARFVNRVKWIISEISRLINGKELTTKDGVQFEKDVNNNKYTLAIPKANPTVHAGLITIKAANNIATVTHELTLSILGINHFLAWISLYISVYINILLLENRFAEIVG